MRLSHFNIVFILLVLIVGFSSFITIWQGTQAQKESMRLESELSSACEEALNCADNHSINVFEKEEARNETIETFYDSIRNTRGLRDVDINRYNIRFEIPCVVLIDNDGFYVHYMHLGHNNTYSDYTTPKQSFSASYGSEDIVLTFYMDGTVTYVLPNGTRGELHDLTNMRRFADEHSGLSFLCQKETLDAERNRLMAEQIRNTLNYYVNTHPGDKNKYVIQYDINVAAIDDAVMESMDGPGIIAFSQSNQTKSKYSRTNVYSMTAYDEVKKTRYKVLSDGMYHLSGCSKATGTFIGWMQGDEAAKEGYEPCPDCVMR